MRGVVPFRALGRDLELRFTTNALCRVEAVSGRGFSELAAELGGNFRITDLRILFAAGADITELAEAGDAIDELGLQVAGELVGKAIMAAFPEASAEGNGKAAA